MSLSFTLSFTDLRISFMQTELSGAEGNDSIEFIVIFFRDNLTSEVVVEFYTESGSAEGSMFSYNSV